MSGDEENPLLIVPPLGLLPVARAKPVPPTESVPGEPEEFITLPPGITDSATHRVESPRIVPRARRAVGEEIVFFPVLPGPPAVAALPTLAIPDESIDETRASVPHSSSTAIWSITLPTGQSVPIASALVIGRDPMANASRPAAALLPALDPAKSLSKTHAMFEIDDDILWVHDLDSTNGVFVAAQGLDVVKVDPGTRMMVPDGAEVELGEFIVTAVYSSPRRLASP